MTAAHKKLIWLHLRSVLMSGPHDSAALRGEVFIKKVELLVNKATIQLEYVFVESISHSNQSSVKTN